MEIWYKIRGYLAAGFALISCPCHLVFALPLLLGVTAGTAAGAFLEKNYGFIIVVSIIVFIGALVLAVHWLGNALPEEESDSPRQSPTPLKRSPTKEPLHHE